MASQVVVALVASVLICACGTGNVDDAGGTSPDADAPDAGPSSPDAGVPDAGGPSPDAGAPDAGGPSPDAGATSPDAGPTPPDAGATSPDAGPTSPDAGPTSPDAGASSLDAGASNVRLNGYHLVEVPLPNGDSEMMYVVASSPVGEGPFPVVIFAHGQGAETMTNCSPDGVPVDTEASIAERTVGVLSDAGYVAVAPLFRTRGLAAPGAGTIRPRDHAVYDASAVLAAAQWARTTQGAGTADVSFTGVSMGSFAVLWAASNRPELAPLQQGLNIKLVAPAGMLGSHIANVGRNADRLVSSDLVLRRQTIAFATLATLAFAPFAEAPVGFAFTNQSAMPYLTDNGRQLVSRFFIDASPACSSPLAPICSAECAQTVGQELVNLFGTDWNVGDFLTPEAVEAVTYFSPPGAVDPGADVANSLLAEMRRRSPVHSLDLFVAERATPLLSLGDNIILQQVTAQNVLGDAYALMFQQSSAQLPDPLPLIEDPACGHGDYYRPDRPQCGWNILLSELALAHEE